MTYARLAVVAVFVTAACTKTPPSSPPSTDGKTWSTKKSPPGMPEVGEKCEGYRNDKYCIDNATLLTCVNGRFAKSNCRDCTQIDHGESTETIQIDCYPVGLGAEGAACTGDSRDCDGIELVVCDGGSFHHYACEGPKACSVDHGVHCDTRVTHPGTACRGDANACSADGKTLLQCKDGTFKLRAPCGGPNGCTFADDQIECDASQADIGDGCVEGTASCTRDARTWLSCESGRFAPVMQCAGADGKCVTDGGQATCNHSGIAELGSPCMVRNQPVCSPDGKLRLTCQGGSFILDKKCKKGCAGEGFPDCK